MPRLSEEQIRAFSDQPERLLDTRWVVRRNDLPERPHSYAQVVEIRDRRVHLVTLEVQLNHWWLPVEALIWGGEYLGPARELRWIYPGARADRLSGTPNTIRLDFFFEGAAHYTSVIGGGGMRIEDLANNYRTTTREEDVRFEAARQERKTQEFLRQHRVALREAQEQEPVAPTQELPAEAPEPVRTSAWQLLKDSV